MASAVLLTLAACSSSGQEPAGTSAQHTAGTTQSNVATPAPGTSPHGHVVVLVMENKPYSAVIGNASAPYLNSLVRRGTSFTDLRAIRHPSQPNYIALFSGSTHGVTDDSCPQHLSGPTLGGELLKAGLSFAGFSENLPAAGSPICFAAKYARKHAPWTNFASLPPAVGRPFTAFPADFDTLPTVSFVVPNLDHDMHDGTVTEGDTWTREHLGAYATWASTHDSLLVVTWDEDDFSERNRIPTLVVGAGVPVRQVSTPVTLYSVLRAIEDRYGLPRIGASASASALGLG